VLSKKLASKKKASQVSRTESDEEDDDFDSVDEDDEEDPDGLPALEPVARRSKPKMPAATPHTNTVFDDQFEQVHLIINQAARKHHSP
jgi:hypothetical protein